MAIILVITILIIPIINPYTFKGDGSVIVNFPKSASSNIKENDIIAITMDCKFIGYGEVKSVLSDCVMISVGKNTAKFFNNIFYEDIQHEFQLL